MDRLAQIAGFVVAVACTALVVARAATAKAPPPLRHATDGERASFAATVAGQEDDWRRKAADDFPEDDWSQRDAFHGHEANAVRDLAGRAHVPYEDVFRSIDDDLHRTSGANATRNVNAVSVKPRPFYD